MALWEYKVITSGQHGFASPALLETHLNTLGKDEWEIIHFHTQPNNPLAFNGLARRSTMRDWVPPEAAVVSAPAAARASEPVAKPAPVHEERVEPAATSGADADPAKPAAVDSGLRKVRDTERDLDPQAQDEEDDWDNWQESEEDLPTFFEALKPLLRRNQKGPGQSVGIDQLARRWELKESDIIGALKECGLTVPESEEQDLEYFEFEGDLYWVNRNNRGQYFINNREKPRPVFRTVPVSRLAADDPAAVELAAERAAEKAELEKVRTERAARQAAADAAREAARLARQQREAEQAVSRASSPAASSPVEPASAPEAATGPAVLPPGAAVLDKIRPHMRRNRRGPGFSGSVSFLSRALDMGEAELAAQFAALGLVLPENSNDSGAPLEIGRFVFWLNKDNRGGIWINGRERREGGAPKPPVPPECPPPPTGSLESPAPMPVTEPVSTEPVAPAAPAVVEPVQAEALPLTVESPASDTSTALAAPESDAQDAAPPQETGHPALAAVRLLLKPNKRGSGFSGEVGYLARTLEKATEEFLATLTGAGLVVPADEEAKPVFVAQSGEIFWINRNSTDGSLWLNAKAAKSAAKKTPSSRPRTRKPKA